MEIDTNYLLNEIQKCHEEITQVKDINTEIRNMSIQIKELTVEMRHMRETQEEHNKRLERLEQRPIKKYDAILNTVMTSLIAGIIGFILAFLKLK